MNLPEEKLEKFKSLLVEEAMSRADAAQAAEDAGIPRNSQEWVAAQDQAENAVQQDILDLLGTDALNRFGALSEADLVVSANLAPSFQDANCPLTPAQRLSIVSAVADSGGLRPTVQGNSAPDPSTWLSAANQQMLAQVSASLSAVQLETLRNSLSQMNEWQSIVNSYCRDGQAAVTFVP